MDDESTPNETKLALLAAELAHVARAVDSAVEKIDSVAGRETPFVTHGEFLPIKLTVYGIWASIGAAVLGAGLAAVLGKTGG